MSDPKPIFFQTNFVFRLKFFPTTKKILDQNYFFRLKFLRPKSFSDQNFFKPNFFQTKYFFQEHFLRPKTFSDQKFSQSKTFLRPKFFYDHNFFSNQKLFRPKNFQIKNFLNKICFWPQICLSKIYSDQQCSNQNIFPTNCFQAKILFKPIFFSNQNFFPNKILFRPKICQIKQLF